MTTKVGAKIDYDEDSKIHFETSKEVKVVLSFDQMGIREDLLRGLVQLQFVVGVVVHSLSYSCCLFSAGIYSFGFDRPSAIQQRSIVPMIKGRDLISQAQSGTGKTTMFSIGVLQV